MSGVDWISLKEAAGILGVSESTVLRTVKDPQEAAETWGDENVGWRLKPLMRRRIFQVSRKRAEEIAAG